MSSPAASTFTELSSTLAQASAQLKRLANNPDAVQGDRIINVLEHIKDRIEDVSIAISTSSDKAEKRHREIFNQQLALEHNKIARAKNSLADHGEYLVVLHDVRTNTPIPGFAARRGDVVSDDEVCDILYALGYEDQVDMEQNRETLAMLMF